MLVQTVKERIENLGVGDFVTTTWAFLATNFPNTEMLAEFAEVIERRIDNCTSQDLANTIWAFATTG